MINGFYKEYWSCERFSERSDSLRLRVNDPGMSLHPSYGSRWESGENGQTTIRLKEDLFQIREAELYLELWGGHPKVGPKGVALNGNAVHPIPDCGTLDGHCEYTYPSIPLSVGELYNGRNSLQFSIGRGGSFWGHMIVDNAALVLGLKDSHPDIQKIRLSARDPRIIQEPSGENDSTLFFKLAVDESCAGLISRVDYFAKYSGYAENGADAMPAWHGYTLNRRHYGHLGSSDSWPHRVGWNTSMLPDQDKEIEVAAVISYAHGVLYRTAPVSVRLPAARPKVCLFVPSELPKPFWSRDGKAVSCAIDLDADMDKVEKAQLHLRIWDGGEGTVKDHFTVNGHLYTISTGLAVHDAVYVVRDIDPAHLRAGRNELRLLSDTEHHGIEVLLPGPALMLRFKE